VPEGNAIDSSTERINCILFIIDHRCIFTTISIHTENMPRHVSLILTSVCRSRVVRRQCEPRRRCRCCWPGGGSTPQSCDWLACHSLCWWSSDPRGYRPQAGSSSAGLTTLRDSNNVNSEHTPKREMTFGGQWLVATVSVSLPTEPRH